MYLPSLWAAQGPAVFRLACVAFSAYKTWRMYPVASRRTTPAGASTHSTHILRSPTSPTTTTSSMNSAQRHARNDSADSAGRSAQAMRNVRDVPSSVASLLEACRRMQDALKRWSALQENENEVSDVFVTVGNEFHSTMAAFAAMGIDTSEFSDFLNDLRGLLEECLSEDPTPENVNYLMPEVRKIIASLLKGLKSKQPAYWQSVQRSNSTGGSW